MDLSGLLDMSSNTYLVAGGAVILLVVAWFILRSGSKNRNVETDTTEKAEKESFIRNESVVRVIENSVSQSISKWRQKMDILKSIRERKKPDIEEHIRETTTPDITPAARENSGEAGLEQETLRQEIRVEEPTYAQEQTAESPEPGPETEAPLQEGGSSLSEGTASTEEEVQSQESETEEMEEYSELEQQKEKSGSDDIFSLFTSDDTEENETSKFAASLDSIDIKDLVHEVEDIKKYLRKR